MLKKDKEQPPFQEKRRYKRVKKNFILTYFELDNPKRKREISQLKNIGLGGMCFITTKHFEAGTRMGIELKTPYLSGTTYLEGRVLQSHSKVANMIFETRVHFNSLEKDAEFLLKELIEYFLNDQGITYEQD